jgi:hypothetical protein
MELRFTTPDGTSYIINLKRNAISLSVNERDVCTFDRAGRLVTAVFDDHTYRRGLDNRVLEKWRTSSESGSTARRRWISSDETGALIRRVQCSVRGAVVGLQAGGTQFNGGGATVVIAAAEAALARIRDFDVGRLEAEASILADIYKPVSILPPDQYLALVLQATEGCHYNRCTFCSFYHDRPFRIKSLPEFRKHLTRVRDFLGEGTTLRRSVFLADANALCIPRCDLLPLLHHVNSELPQLPVYSFVDVFSGRARSENHFRELRQHNVRRLYLGVETGCRELLRFLRKPQCADDVKRTVAAIKAGGLNIGIIIMLGIGGQAFAERHVAESAELLNSLPWSAGDIVFLSEFIEFPNLEYAELARKAGIEPIAPIGRQSQYQAMRAEIRRTGGFPRIAPYNAEEFIY